MEDVFLSSLVHEYEQAVARNKAQEQLLRRAIPLLQHTSILEGLQKQLAIAQEEIHRYDHRVQQQSGYASRR